MCCVFFLSDCRDGGRASQPQQRDEGAQGDDGRQGRPKGASKHRHAMDRETRKSRAILRVIVRTFVPSLRSLFFILLSETSVAQHLGIHDHRGGVLSFSYISMSKYSCRTFLWQVKIPCMLQVIFTRFSAAVSGLSSSAVHVWPLFSVRRGCSVDHDMICRLCTIV